MITTLLILLIFSLSFALLFVTHRINYQRRIKKEGHLSITTGNKDRDINLSEYHHEIEEFLWQMRYSKKVETESSSKVQVYQPRPIQKIYGGKVTLTQDPYSIELSGPYHILKILEGILETPGSSFQALKSHDTDGAM